MSAPAFAMVPDGMTCADYTAMGTEEQMAAMAPAEGAMDEGGTAGAMMSADDAMSPDHMAMEAAEACEAHPDMTVGEAMKAGY
jgi:hypothetical protein